MKLIKDVRRILGKSQATVLFLLPSFFIFSQKDTIQLYDDITILATHQKIEQHNSLTAEQIQVLSSEDLGTLLQHINGLTLRNYGGIGSMKTLSNRGLGGEHNQLIMDGMPINDPQNGQINFGAIPSSQIESISSNFQFQEELIPVSALIKGSDIQVKTFLQEFSFSPISVRFHTKIGGFGLKNIDFGLKNGGKRHFISLGGGHLSSDGNYPFLLKMGDEFIRKKRQNNEFKNYHLTFGSGLRWGKSIKNEIKINANANFIKQQLPGAVILYNDLAKETLETKNAFLGLRYQLKSNKTLFSTFANYSNRYLGYYDPNYLNIDGFIDNRYNVNSSIGGFHIRTSFKNWSLQAGNDLAYDVLHNNRNLLGKPTRLTNTSMLKVSYSPRFFTVETGLFSQIFLDNNLEFRHTKEYTKLHPQISIRTSDKLLEDWQFFAWYKPSSRVPSFNELYFSQIGNKELEPEETSQINLGGKHLFSKEKFTFSIQGNVFKNVVKNKIVTFPTKNMFIWSILNLGKVDIFGADLHLLSEYQFFSDFKIKFQIGVNYQKALDVTDSSSPSYRHQIAYTPEWQGISSFNFHYKNAGLHLNGIYTGQRFSLNENIPTNLLTAFSTFDLSGSYIFPIKNKHFITILGGIRNITNQQEGFIRSFVMPGRNYFIQLSYEFN